MPPRRNARKRKPRRKTHAKKASPKKYGSRISRPIAGSYGAFLAPRITTKLRYNDAFSIISAVGVMNDYQFRLNSIYDPDMTGAGHQPLGRDQLAALYNRYRVDKVFVKVEFSKASEGACCGHALVANNDQTNFTNPFSVIYEQSNSKIAVDSNSTAGSKSKTVLKKMYTLRNITGVTSSKYKSDDAYSSPVATNPAETIQLHIINCDVLNATTTTTVMNVSMIFYVEFFDPFVVGQS